MQRPHGSPRGPRRRRDPLPVTTPHCTTCTCATAQETEGQAHLNLTFTDACSLHPFHKGRCSGARKSTCPAYGHDNPGPTPERQDPHVTARPDGREVKTAPALMCWRDHVCSETPHLCNGYPRALSHRNPTVFDGSMIQTHPGV